MSNGTRWHNLVHSTVLKSFTRQDEPQDLVQDKVEVWKVEEIDNFRRVKGVLLCGVYCAGYMEFEGVWETINGMDDYPHKLK